MPIDPKDPVLDATNTGVSLLAPGIRSTISVAKAIGSVFEMTPEKRERALSTFAEKMTVNTLKSIPLVGGAIGGMLEAVLGIDDTTLTDVMEAVEENKKAIAGVQQTADEIKKDIAEMKKENKEAFDELKKQSQEIKKELDGFRLSVANDFKKISQTLSEVTFKIEDSTRRIISTAALVAFETNVVEEMREANRLFLRMLKTGQKYHKNAFMNHCDKQQPASLAEKALSYIENVVLDPLMATMTKDEYPLKKTHEKFREYMNTVLFQIIDYFHKTVPYVLAKIPVEHTSSWGEKVEKLMDEYYTNNDVLIMLTFFSNHGIFLDGSTHMHTSAEKQDKYFFTNYKSGQELLIVRSRKPLFVDFGTMTDIQNECGKILRAQWSHGAETKFLNLFKNSEKMKVDLAVCIPLALMASVHWSCGCPRVDETGIRRSSCLHFVSASLTSEFPYTEHYFLMFPE